MIGPHLPLVLLCKGSFAEQGASPAILFGGGGGLSSSESPLLTARTFGSRRKAGEEVRDV